MELKPTFFSVSGFLVPGVVLIGSSSGLALGHYYSSIPAFIAASPSLPAEGAAAVLLCTLAAVALLALSFVTGAILSESFIFVGRRLILRPLKRQTLRDNVVRLFTHKTLEALIRADMDAREAYIYMHTCGLDLHWYAGRIRMMGGTGLALLIVATISSQLGYSWTVFLGIIATAVLSFGVALYRSLKFDEYVAAASAVINRGGGADGNTNEG